MNDENDSKFLSAEEVGFNKKTIEEAWDKNEIYKDNMWRQQIYAMDQELAEDKVKLIDWSDLNNKEFPEGRWRIKNLIPYEGFVILSSISGEKKTWIALEMAKCISHDINFLNLDDFKVLPANVLYLDAENPQAEMQKRGRQLGFSNDSVNKLTFYNTDDLNLNDESQAEDFKNLIFDGKYDVIFIDTMRAVAGALKEDKAEEVRQFFNRFKELKNKGVVIVFLDHLRKPSNFDKKEPKKEHLLGSQDKTASVEVLLMLKSESGTDEINVYQRKNRLGKEINPFKITMNDFNDSGVVKTIFKFEGNIDFGEDKKEEAKDLILDILNDGENKNSKEIISLLSKQVGQKNTRNALKELTMDGLIEVSKNGRQNVYCIKKESEDLLKDF